MAEQYTSIKTIFEKIYRHPLMTDISIDLIIDYTVDFMHIVGIPEMFVDKVEKIVVRNHRAQLPCDYVYTEQIKGEHGYYVHSSDSFHLLREPAGQTIINEDCRTITPPRDVCAACATCPNRPICDEYHFNYNHVQCISLLRSVTQPTQSVTENTFIIQGNFIFTSNETDVIDISYHAIATDEDGFPLIPDNSNFFRALMAYIKKEYFTILFDMSKIHQNVLAQAQQDYSFYVGSCITDMRKFDLAKAESFFNSFRTLLVHKNDFYRGFKK